MERKLENDGFFLVPHFVAFLAGDAVEMSRTAAVARGKRFTEDMISHLEAERSLRSGSAG